MKVIVFGGTGFLGSHVADELSRRGHDVIIFDIKESPFINGNQKMIVGNILDEEQVKNAMAGCDYVYNFAAIADIDDAKNNPIKAVRVNILGNTVLLEAARVCGVKRFIFASSIYVYSGAGSFYRSSKQACELIVENYYQVYGLEYNILRYGSLYGPRSGEENWMYRALRQALVEKRIVRDGDGEELREYIHVGDAARLSADILDEKCKNQHLVLTGSQQIRIKDLLLMIREIFEGKISIEYRPSSAGEHYEITPYVFKPQLARRVTPPDFVDLGQGILDMLGELHRDLQQKGMVLER